MAMVANPDAATDAGRVPTIEHAGQLEDLPETPGYLMPHHELGRPQVGKISCSYCGVGDGGTFERVAEAAAVGEPGRGQLTVVKESIRATTPTGGCVKLRLSTMRQRSAYPIHTMPSVLDRGSKTRRPIPYDEAISRLADRVLAHLPPRGHTLIYASGQLDYFSIFALQETFRLLGVRNLTGNAEHCLNAGAVHNEILTGQEGPFLTLAQAAEGPGRFYLFNGWNGFVSHPPAFRAFSSRPDFDAFLIEVMVTESAKALAKQLGKERVVLIRPKGDPHLALAVAHQILTQHPWAVHRRFLERFAEPGSFERFSELARSPAFAPERVAERLAPEPPYAERILQAVRLLAYKMVQPGMVPINVPSVGLSQTSGVVAHCLWGNVMAMVGKYGLNADGSPAGGTLRLPGQINAESEVQGLSRKYFLGRVPVANRADAARRMHLPDDAYDPVDRDPPRAALDYSEPTPGRRELFVCVGTQFEANMMGRRRWLDKLTSPDSRLIVIDPIPDPFSEQHAELIIPSPPHPATTKLYQNGEWKLTLSVPQKRAAPETRSDATIFYDMMAEITARLEAEHELAALHPELARHARSGYLRQRFCPPPRPGAPGLTRIDGEVSRPELWERIDAYLRGGSGPLYCRFEHDDGRPIAWSELLERGSLYYGGVGTRRFRLDYDDPSAHPFRDIYRRPGTFRFFTPTADDLTLPEGILLNSGRSSLSDDRDRIAFATSTFNSGKATPIVNMPDDNPLHVSPSLAERLGLHTGDRVRAEGRESGKTVELPVVVSDRVKGDTVYVSFHKSKAQMQRGVYVNDLTSHLGRCAYSAQTSMKATSVALERVVDQPAHAPRLRRIDTTHIDPRSELPIWSGQATHLHVTDVLRETHDVYTFRFQGDPLCRFVYWPGQFCSLVLNIDGKKIVRSYSISSTPTRPYVLEITVKRVPGGIVSNWLPDHLKVGDRVEISGPRGKFCLEPGKVPPKILFLAAGSGITPLMSMARWLCDVSAETDVKFFNSIRTPDDLIFDKELDLMTSRYRMFEPIYLTASRGGSRGWTGMTGRISADMLRLVVPDLHERHVYMCGPEGFMDASRVVLEQLGFNLANLHSESFGGVRTSVANKALPLPGGGHLVDPPAAEAGQGAFAVQFARAGKTVRASRSLPLLEIAEAHDVDLDYGCRTGNCGACKVRLLSGDVDRGDDEGLDKQERSQGFILACVAKPLSNCTLDC